MQSTAAVAGAKTRGQRQTVGEQRRKLPKGLVEGQVFALESADDAEGFSFWRGRAGRLVHLLWVQVIRTVLCLHEVASTSAVL